jgi:uncharacterized DUF497 family protein
MKISGFHWDEGNLDKCQKHGLSVDEIEYVLANAPHIAPDFRHSTDEQRWIAVGRTPSRRAAFVAFALRGIEGETWVRAVSARFMHSKEVRRYEQVANKSPDSEKRR